MLGPRHPGSVPSSMTMKRVYDSGSELIESGVRRNALNQKISSDPICFAGRVSDR